MMNKLYEPEVLDSLNLEEIFKLSGFPKDFFNDLREIGAFDEFQNDSSSFSSRSIVVFKKVNRLRKTFDLDTNSVALLLHYIDEVDKLENEVRRLSSKY